MKNYQSVLFPYAYNILGSAEDAKDAVQDVILKYTTKGIAPDNEKNYLVKSVINQSINIKKQRQRQQPNKEWLPEPVSTERSDLGVELRELVSYSLLFLLEQLNPKERAVFILKEAFAYTHEEIAEVLSISIENSRKLLSRAANKVKQNKKSSPKASASTRQIIIIDKLMTAIRDRDLEGLHGLFTEDIAYYADGGKKVKVVSKFTTGIREVSELLIYVFHKFQRKNTFKLGYLNHQPALLCYYRDKLISCAILEFSDDRSKIKSMSVIIDPEKLKNFNLTRHLDDGFL